MSNSTVTYVVGGGCALIALLAFTMLVIVPAMTAWRTVPQKIGVAILSLYVLAALVGVGVLLGAVIIFEWPRLF